MMNDFENRVIKFSVVIPITFISDYLRETCQELNKITKKNFEILIFSNNLKEDINGLEKELGAKIFSVGDVSPAIKRDMALKYAQGEYLAFTDDDAYPDERWLEIAEKYLTGKGIAAVGGPQLTPRSDSFWQKVSGAMFMSPLSGKAIIRYCQGKRIREVDDWPTVNFIIKKEDFEAIGGFDSNYWPGEDTKLCLDIVKKLKKKILYIPELVVFHHRRAGFGKHLKQVGNYGVHRGYFAKAFPDTSMKFDRFYFVPSLFVIYLFFGLALSMIYPGLIKFYLIGLSFYVLALAYSTFSLNKKTKNIFISIMTIPYLISFHVWYGIRFMQGFFFTKDLKSKLGR